MLRGPEIRHPQEGVGEQFLSAQFSGKKSRNPLGA